MIALGVSQHQFHRRVAVWVEAKQFTSLLTCPITELGFIRILGQTRTYVADFDQAKRQLDRLKRNTEYSISFLSDDQDADRLPTWVTTSNQTTDGHLLQLALAHGAELATFDQGIPGAFAIP